MKPWIWLIVAALGWAVMLGGFMSRARPDSSAPWSSGLIVIGPSGSDNKDKDKDKDKDKEKGKNASKSHKEKGKDASKAAEKPKADATPKATEAPAARAEKPKPDAKSKAAEASPEAAPFADAIPVHLRLLSANDIAEMLMILLGDGAPDKAIGTKAAVRTKLIEVPLDKASLNANALRSGRLPEPGHDEILAGARIEHREQLIVGGRKLKVVGVLKPDVTLFEWAYILPPDASMGELFRADLPSAYDARLVKLPADYGTNAKLRSEFDKVFPSAKYTAYAPADRLDPQAYYLYVAGLALLLLGGSGALIGLYCWLADWPVMSTEGGPRFFAAPLAEIKQRRRLMWAVHLIYFGIVIAACIFVYEQPAVQAVFLGKIGEALKANSGPLAAAGKAYLSGNIARAAAVTFLVNFFLGSLAYITLPSVILFGFGLVLSWLRALLWGLLLAPTMVVLATSMLPHSGTMLLEGEGYILAAFFGCLIPIHTVSSRLGGNPLSRWGRVLLLNLTGSFWVALVLVVAAIYEATEVIWMMR
jgi:hypothetical protein